MKIVVDESVSYGVALTLKEAGHDVIAIAESPTSGIIDEDIFNLVIESSAWQVIGGTLSVPIHHAERGAEGGS